MGQQTPGAGDGSGTSPETLAALQSMRLSPGGGGSMNTGAGIGTGIGTGMGAQGIMDPSILAASRTRMQPGMGAGAQSPGGGVPGMRFNPNPGGVPGMMGGPAPPQQMPPVRFNPSPGMGVGAPGMQSSAPPGGMGQSGGMPPWMNNSSLGSMMGPGVNVNDMYAQMPGLMEKIKAMYAGNPGLGAQTGGPPPIAQPGVSGMANATPGGMNPNLMAMLGGGGNVNQPPQPSY